MRFIYESASSWMRQIRYKYISQHKAKRDKDYSLHQVQPQPRQWNTIAEAVSFLKFYHIAISFRISSQYRRTVHLSTPVSLAMRLLLVTSGCARRQTMIRFLHSLMPSGIAAKLPFSLMALISAFISAISAGSLASHSSRVLPQMLRECFLPSGHIGEYLPSQQFSLICEIQPVPAFRFLPT